MTVPTQVPTFTARAVVSDGVSLATRDYGGSGAPLVLMHGAGMGQGSLEALAAELSRSYRVLTFDFRGHGGSSPGPWTMASAVQDLTAVVSAFGLVNPAVAGHSLGGMVAAAYGERHPDCPGAVNIDGHGLGRVEQYVGRAEADVRAWWALQERKLSRVMLLVGVLAPLARLLRKPLPSRTVTREVSAAVDGTDLFALYRSVQCPLLVFNATADEDRPAALRFIGPDGLAMLRAYRAGLRRDLAALAVDHPHVEVVEVEATHQLIGTRPAEVAGHIHRFLGG